MTVRKHLSTSRRISTRLFAHSFNWLRRLVILATLLAVTYYAYRYSFRNIIHGSLAPGLILFWVISAYITVPRLHRWLTKIYLPEHYHGRSRTSDGLLGDPINIAVYATAKQLRDTMLAAGWVETDKGTPKNLWRAVQATVLKQSYPAAPGGTQYLFGYPQTFSFQKEVGGYANTRHHVRFWKTPPDSWLPGGYQADWLGAAHFDKYLGLGTFNGQIMHKITESIDHERNMLVEDMKQFGNAKVNVVDHFSTAFTGRGGGGDRIRTDGAMPFVDLRTDTGTSSAGKDPIRSQTVTTHARQKSRPSRHTNIR